VTTSLQVRDVPDDVSRVLKARAARAGKSLSEYVLGELVEMARRPTLADVLDELESRPVTRLNVSAADLIRAGRDERDRTIAEALDRADRPAGAPTANGDDVP